MKCKSPFFSKDQRLLFPCGQCLFCRIQKRRRWTARLILENFCHEKSIFLTLTYSDDHLPHDGSVSKRDVQLFLKRLRKNLNPRKIRYFFCGEYGDNYLRPHYHAVIFGLSEDDAEIIFNSWQKGRIQIDDVNQNSISYVAGYVSKKFNGSKDKRIRDGDLKKEFALMSKKPALGSNALKHFEGYETSQSGFDVLQVFRSGGKSHIFDKFLRKKMREKVFDERHIEDLKLMYKEVMQDEILEKVQEEFGEVARSRCEILMNAEDLHFSESEELANLIGEAYYNQNCQNVEAEERIINRASSRKDL